jgi:hypothetical protein
MRSSRAPLIAAVTVARSYSFTPVMSARACAGTLATALACGPVASTAHGTSMMSSSARNGSVPRFGRSSGMTAPVLPAIAEMVISAMRS